ncbi:MAG: hypothetical protein SFY70_01820 [Bacteroidia bacterium]|nr:hypothetical protein [Bacteroidia bacterium]
MGRALGWGSAFARKDLLGPVPKTVAPCAPVRRVKAAASCLPCAAEYLPLGRVEVDPRRFQNREAEFSEASVERITSGYDPNLLDPVVVWKDPKTGQVLVLSGHSRYEAHRRLGKARLPVRFFQGSEAEARDYARGFANRAATPETLVEDLKVLREFKAKAAPQKALKQAFGPRLRRLEDLSYLAPTGRFLALLAQDETVQRQLPYAELKASWVGELRKKYPQLTARHEDELFEYFLTTPKTIVPKKEELFDLVARRVGRADFGPNAALGLRVASTGTEARADTGPSQRRIYEIDREMTMLEQQRRLAQTAEEKRVLRDQLTALEHERGYLTRGIETALRTQSALFGPRPRTLKSAKPYRRG